MVKKPARYVAYPRVNTQKQGQSGLGLEAQRSAVEAFARRQAARIGVGRSGHVAVSEPRSVTIRQCAGPGTSSTTSTGAWIAAPAFIAAWARPRV
jgi:hypothetical protein